MNYKQATKLSPIFFFMAAIVHTTFAAAIASWQIIPEESSLSFTGTQNNAPVQGEFKRFSGEITADPNKLEESHIKIQVDLASVNTSFKDIADTLKTTEWFDVTTYPQAIYESSKFTKIKDNTLQSDGSLSLHGKSMPVLLLFTYEQVSANKIRVIGSTQLKRNDFGVGQGDWSSTDEIKNEVEVNFVVTATKK